MGLYDYPVLMAADILLYNANLVPVGEDQKQHVELTRDIATSFNSKYKTNLFTIPEPMISGKTTRVMSLQDGTKKMSKSDENTLGCIYLLDDNDIINKKIKKAKTDSDFSLSYTKDRPEIYNLLNIFSELNNESPEAIVARLDGKGHGAFKQELSDIIINYFSPIRERILDLKQNKDFLITTLEENKFKAKEIASKKLDEVKEVFGLKI